MRNSVWSALAVAGSAAVACAGVSPFVESFDSDASGWLAGSFGALDYDPAGFVSNSVDLSSAGPFGLTVFRGHDDFDASGDAFVGDYLTSGITAISMDVRHDSATALDLAVRVAQSSNAPAFAIETDGPVAGGEWVTLTFELDPNNPLYTPEGAPGFGFFAGVASAVGNLQLSVSPEVGLPSGTFVTFDLDNVRLIPSPGGGMAVMLGMILANGRRRR